MPPAHRRGPAAGVATVALAAVAVVSAGFAARAEQPSAPPTRASNAAKTPVLSARRVPGLLGAPIADQRLAARLIEVLGNSPGAACLSVSTSGRTVYANRASEPMVPASLQKLVTASAALAILGPDTTLTTTLRSTAQPSGGELRGDLYLVGAGDPLLMTQDFTLHLKHVPPERTDLAKLADGLASAGVKVVRGRLLGDESRYDSERYPPSWPPRYGIEAESGPISALTVNSGFDGYPPSQDAGKPLIHPADDPPANAAAVFARLLEARGVTVEGGTGTGSAPANAAVLAKLASSPVRAIVAEMLRESDNLAAELMTKEVGAVVGARGTTLEGVQAERNVLGRLGLPMDGTSQVDGSGLSSDDRETCAMVRAVLDRDGPNGVIGSTLPVAARSGTLEKRFVDSAVAGRLRAKTGTLLGVTALAGVLPTARGVTVTFSYMLNLPRARKITASDLAIEDDLVAALDDYPNGPDLAALGPQ